MNQNFGAQQSSCQQGNSCMIPQWGFCDPTCPKLRLHEYFPSNFGYYCLMLCIFYFIFVRLHLHVRYLVIINQINYTCKCRPDTRGPIQQEAPCILPWTDPTSGYEYQGCLIDGRETWCPIKRKNGAFAGKEINYFGICGQGKGKG